MSDAEFYYPVRVVPGRWPTLALAAVILGLILGAVAVYAYAQRLPEG